MCSMQAAPRRTAHAVPHAPQRCRAESGDEAQKPDQAAADTWSLPSSFADSDWRDFRAQLVAREAGSGGASTSESKGSWAHLLPGPEPGCILLANPLMFTEHQQYFKRAVILIVEHTEHHSQGIILNKATNITLRETMKGANADDTALDFETSGWGVFGDNKLHIGGDCEMSFMTLHPHDVFGAREVRKGIYVDGGPKLADYVSSGKAEPSSVKWYFKYSGWGGGQLASELERSVWYPVSCSSDLLTADVSPDAPDEMWCSIMELVDDDFRRTSEQVRIEGRRQENTDD